MTVPARSRPQLAPIFEEMNDVLTHPPLLRRCDVIDADLRVVMRGPSPDRMAPIVGEVLEPEFGREVAAVVATHDFRRHPIATALVGTDYGLRIAALPGLGTSHYSVAIERISLGRRLRAITALYRLGDAERELLRLLVGGYHECEIAKRLDASLGDLRRQTRALRGKMRCTRRSDLVALVFTAPAPEDSGALRQA